MFGRLLLAACYFYVKSLGWGKDKRVCWAMKGCRQTTKSIEKGILPRFNRSEMTNFTLTVYDIDVLKRICNTGRETKDAQRKERTKMKMKKLLTLGLAAAIGLTMAACSGDTQNSSSEGTSSQNSSSESSTSESSVSETSTDGEFAETPIVVLSREDGSGTRSAFVELFEIEEEDADGNKVDNTTEDAEITNSTAVMLTTVSGNPAAIGYISLGSLNDTVKALKVDGVEPTADNVKSGDYKISRPFNIATNGDVSEVAQDFINYILSADGQAVVEEEGYIKVSDADAFSTPQPSGKVVVAGSSSVTPVMEVLRESYLALNPNAEIEIQESDSTTGMNSAIDGVCDIGMASRDLKDSEIEKGLTGTVIAQDGIAVIVNNETPIDDISSESVKGIYTGELTTWGEVK